MLAALPLVPVDQIDEVFMHAMSEMPDDIRCRQLADYVVTNWLEGPLSVVQWNHADTEGHRTNNHLEGWHRKLNNQVKKAHPNIYEFINHLRKIQASNEVKMIQYNAGGKRPKLNNKYRKLQTKLNENKQRLEGVIDIIQFARTVCYMVALD